MALLRALRECLAEWWRWQLKDGWTHVESKPAEFHPVGFQQSIVYVEVWRNDATGEIRCSQLTV